jgi:hypothetical protein
MKGGTQKVTMYFKKKYILSPPRRLTAGAADFSVLILQQ